MYCCTKEDLCKDIYMDVAASTAPSRSVLNKFNQTVLDSYANPSSAHAMGVNAKKIINEASEIIAKKLNCQPYELHYTSGATMSNNIAIQGFIKTHKKAIVLYSAVEHNYIIELCESIHTDDSLHDAYKIPVNKNGFVDIDLIEAYLKVFTYGDKKVPILVSIQMANSESGVIQNIKAISDIVHEYPNGYLHTDATQYIPYYSVDVKNLGVDMLSMSGQKIHGLKGTGLLYVEKNVCLSPIIYGEQGLIGGTENVYGIAALGQAFYDLDYSADRFKTLVNLRYYLLSALSEIGIDMQIVGCHSSVYRLPNNVYVCFKGVDAEQLVQLLSERGVYVSTGSACSSGKKKSSHVVMAYGFSEADAQSCIRFTLDENITHEDIIVAVNWLQVLIPMIKKSVEE